MNPPVLPMPPTILGVLTVGLGSILFSQANLGTVADATGLSGVSNIVGTGGLVTILIIIVRYLLKMYEAKDTKLVGVLFDLVAKQQEQNVLLLTFLKETKDEMEGLRRTIDKLHERHPSP